MTDFIKPAPEQDAKAKDHPTTTAKIFHAGYSDHGDTAASLRKMVTTAQDRNGGDLPKVSDENLAQLIAADLKHSGRLDSTTPVGQALFHGLLDKYEQSGAKGVQEFLDQVNKELGGSLQLSMREDPDTLKRYQDLSERQGQKIGPDFLRWIDMKDKDGQPKGKMVFVHESSNPKGTPI